MINSFIPIFSEFTSRKEYIPIDLSSKNQNLEKIDISSSKALEVFILNYLEKNKGLVAFGGYLEKRAIYDRSKSFNHSNPEKQRNIHLGLDFWCNAGTSVAAPFDGTVHSFRNNDQIADYGPTIILKHFTNHQVFYTLYGHLDLASLAQLEIGQVIQKGATFCRLGSSAINGDYAPHLHFQIIKNIEQYYGNYPGVCSSSDVSFYLKNCPDPASYLHI